MDQHSTVQWVPITINLFVHIFMYYVSRLQCPTLPLLNSQAAGPVALFPQANLTALHAPLTRAVLRAGLYQDPALVEALPHAAPDRAVRRGHRRVRVRVEP